MKHTPLFAAQASSTKPRAQLHNQDVIKLNMLRNQFTIKTWLLLGAAMQAILVSLPIRKVYAIAPAFVFLAWQITDHLLMTLGWKKNIYMNGVIQGKHSAIYPAEDGSFDRSGYNGPGITVVLLGARSNHPLGMFSPGMRQAAKFLANMGKDLQENSAHYDWLGGTFWTNGGDRLAGGELMQVFYFRTKEGLDKFSHGKAHREGWDWYNKLVKTDKTLAFNHEVYSVEPAKWENIYLNMAPSGFGTTSMPVVDKQGNTRWVSPIVDASRGHMRSSRGRMGWDNGSGNEKYGEEPWEEALEV